MNNADSFDWNVSLAKYSKLETSRGENRLDFGSRLGKWASRGIDSSKAVF